MGDEVWRRGHEPPEPPVDDADATVVELDVAPTPDVGPGMSSAGVAATLDETSPVDGGPVARRRGRWSSGRWIALGVVVVVVVAVGAVALRPSGDDAATGEVVAQRAELAEAWSTEFAGRVDRVRIADGGVFVMSALDGLVVRYELATGDEVWSASIGDARDPGDFEVAGELVVVGTQLRSNRGQAVIGRVHVLDRDDGSEVWREATTGATYRVDDDVVLRRVSRRVGATGQLLDIGSGEPLGEVLALGTRPHSAGDVLASGLGASVRIVSLDDGSIVRPEIPSDGIERVIGVGDDVLATSPSGAVSRVEDDGALTPLGPARIDPSGGSVRLEAVGDDAILAVADATERFDIGADSFTSAWTVPGPSGSPVETVVGPAVIAQLTDPDGSTSYALVDLDDGSIRWRTRPGRRVDAPTLLADGVLLPPMIGESQSLAALDIDGEELWTVELPAALTATAVADGAVAVASRTGDTSSVTVHR